MHKGIYFLFAILIFSTTVSAEEPPQVSENALKQLNADYEYFRSLPGQLGMPASNNAFTFSVQTSLVPKDNPQVKLAFFRIQGPANSQLSGAHIAELSINEMVLDRRVFTTTGWYNTLFKTGVGTTVDQIKNQMGRFPALDVPRNLPRGEFFGVLSPLGSSTGGFGIWIERDPRGSHEYSYGRKTWKIYLTQNEVVTPVESFQVSRLPRADEPNFSKFGFSFVLPEGGHPIQHEIIFSYDKGDASIQVRSESRIHDGTQWFLKHYSLQTFSLATLSPAMTFQMKRMLNIPTGGPGGVHLGTGLPDERHFLAQSLRDREFCLPTGVHSRSGRRIRSR